MQRKDWFQSGVRGGLEPLVALALAMAACGDRPPSDDGAAEGIASVGDTSEAEGSSASHDGPADGSSGGADNGGTADTADTGAAETGPGAGCGAPQSCEANPGRPDGAGHTSGAPFGCGGGGFERAFLWLGPDVEAGKAVPVLADLDDDGALDVVMNPRTLEMWVLAGAGDGSFAAPLQLPGTDTVCGWGSDVGEFTGDGILDVAIGDHCVGARAWRGSGGMSFADSSTGVPFAALSGCGLGDVDDDGDHDLMCGADQFGTGFVVAFSDGAGGWTTATPSGLPGLGAAPGIQNIGHFAFADREGDGDLDAFAFGQGDAGGVTAFVYDNGGNGQSWSSLAQLPGGTGPWIGTPVQGSVGDVQCDGIPDVASGGAVHLGGGSGFGGGAAVDGSNISHFGDLDGDGFLDLVTHSEEGGLRAYVGDGAGGFVLAELGLPGASYVPPEFAQATLSEVYGIDIGDVDGDGRLDVVRWYKMDVPVPGGFGAAAQHLLEVWRQVE